MKCIYNSHWARARSERIIKAQRITVHPGLVTAIGVDYQYLVDEEKRLEIREEEIYGILAFTILCRKGFIYKGK